MKDRITLPTCVGCPHYLCFEERLPKKQYGVLMKPGERYCLGQKRAMHFKPKDPKRRPPAWCPKRKSPCEVRIYAFKSTEDWYLHEMLCRDLGKDLMPEASRYYVEQELTIDMTPKQFWESLEEKLLSELLPITVYEHSVIEIDDGIKPVCFYKAGDGLQIIPYFDTARAQANKQEERS